MKVWKIIFFVLQNSQAYPKQNSLTFSLYVKLWSLYIDYFNFFLVALKGFSLNDDDFIKVKFMFALKGLGECK